MHHVWHLKSGAVSTIGVIYSVAQWLSNCMIVQVIFYHYVFVVPFIWNLVTMTSTTPVGVVVGWSNVVVNCSVVDRVRGIFVGIKLERVLY